MPKNNYNSKSTQTRPLKKAYYTVKSCDVELPLCKIQNLGVDYNPLAVSAGVNLSHFLSFTFKTEVEHWWRGHNA
jgi:hypothetical protein